MRRPYVLATIFGGWGVRYLSPQDLCRGEPWLRVEHGGRTIGMYWWDE